MREDYDAKDEKKDRGPKKGGARRGGFRKKVCRFCANNTAPDYKNPDQLKRYTTERGKILPARITGNCAKHQRAVTAEIKKARILGYLPFEKK
ncbi:MAG: 30S ribosomal protein S18 [Sphaerochaetaceae bacterium]|jgi:small subunit ribosomal protein S18|nr:30S ribosomal protein S18 [Sphaerochaetaceae bacterium]MDC7236405.1 30S ribosomal protein S18 [Sphaerochaetaceae bacterium]MDC7243959.1 30S ribosomal protein S18 [Sphaerochaetaceae bacterium]MDC7250901.1 30S ribosomal protein S18 [Sphaerochaetaceae bacterium]